MALRRRLFALGYRYRIGWKVPGLPRRTIDIAFPGRRIAVFVDGCFWHACPTHYVPPKNNAEWWAEKITQNVARDRETDQALLDIGWHPIRIWEHEETESALQRVIAVLEQVTAARDQERISSS